jgi:hypothetical protein
MQQSATGGRALAAASWEGVDNGVTASGVKRPRGPEDGHDNTAVKRARPNGEPFPSSNPSASDELSLQEESTLLRHYEAEIQRICTDAKFDRAIVATSVIFFKRFFLHNSMLEYIPREIM